MYYELALISVIVAGGYWGWYFLRHPATRLYGGLQVAAAALSGVGLAGAKLEHPELGIAGAIGVGGGACLLVIGPLFRALAHRLASAERFGLAQRLFDVAEILTPGAGVGEEKAVLAAMREIREGNIERAIETMTSAKDHASPDTRLAIDERIAMLYLASYRWHEAIAHAEEHLFGALPAEPPTGAIALRRALGIAPPVWVELLGAYGYVGDLDQAARMLARLEEVCADRTDANIWLHRGRLMFLALAGRVGAVQELVVPRRSRHMKPAARMYWLGVAHERRGEVAAAEAAYLKARARTRGRPRSLIDQALAQLQAAKPAELGATANELIVRVEGTPHPAVTERLRQRGPIATHGLVVAMLAVAAIVRFAFGSSSDAGVLVRDGALVRGLVRDGEWWRIVSCIFIHVGGFHLFVNVLGLWLLGRLCESIFGPWRLIAIFALSGIVGSCASYLAMPEGISAGASGAILGLVGALLVELILHRRQHRVAWKHGVWGLLAVVTVAQLGVDFLYPITDQWAHGVGLAVGALAGALLSTRNKLTRRVATVIAVAFMLAAAVATVNVAATSIEDSLMRTRLVRHDLGSVGVVVPRSWRASGAELEAPDLVMFVRVERVMHPLDEAMTAELEKARKYGFERVQLATEHVVPPPPEWQTGELAISQPDALGGRQAFRAVVALRSDGVLAVFYMPDMIAREAPGFFTRMLALLQ